MSFLAADTQPCVLIARYSFTGFLTDCIINCYCILMIHVVDGGWSPWRLGPCSKTCGGGLQNITRVCDNPEPSCGGNICSGLSVYQNSCNIHCCPGKLVINLILCVIICYTYMHMYTLQVSYICTMCVICVYTFVRQILVCRFCELDLVSQYTY